jgi:hypothetical protein
MSSSVEDLWTTNPLLPMNSEKYPLLIRNLQLWIPSMRRRLNQGMTNSTLRRRMVVTLIRQMQSKGLGSEKLQLQEGISKKGLEEVIRISTKSKKHSGRT